MCDFLVSLDNRYRGKDLLNLIKKPYGSRAPEGEFFDYPWGSIAILKEHLGDNKNILTTDSTTFAWVGDLVIPSRVSFLGAFIKRLMNLEEHGDNSASIQTDELFEKLNGAFAIILANANGFSIVTDPVNFIPVYVGKNSSDESMSFGTHPDLVAIITGDPLKLDVVSAAEFLNSGNSTFPNTMHANVKEMTPGRVHSTRFATNNKVAIRKDFVYWSPPKEQAIGYDEKELAEELKNTIIRAVRDRCDTERIGVLLSGGLDSRAIIAAVPEEADCVAITFCNQLNREARIARKVARCYGREWIPLIRKREFLANSLVSIVKFSGCEFEWLNAHAAGFVNDFMQQDIGSLLSGFMFDSYFKGYGVADFVGIRQMRGLLPRKYVKRPFNYIDNLAEFWKRNLRWKLVDEVCNRRKKYFEKTMDGSRTSVEYLRSLVFSQDNEAAYWIADRRVVPIRLVAADRGVLDFAFKCPVEAKLGGKIFLQAVGSLYGAGGKIPNANSGVRPCSSHLLRLPQLTVRKLQQRAAELLEKLGKKHKEQGSWSDYPWEWARSSLLESLRNQYAHHLDEFDGVVFEGRARDLLYSRNIRCMDGFRVLQLAVWRAIIREYREDKYSLCD